MRSSAALMIIMRIPMTDWESRLALSRLTLGLGRRHRRWNNLRYDKYKWSQLIWFFNLFRITFFDKFISRDVNQIWLRWNIGSYLNIYDTDLTRQLTVDVDKVWMWRYWRRKCECGTKILYLLTILSIKYNLESQVVIRRCNNSIAE